MKKLILSVFISLFLMSCSHISTHVLPEDEITERWNGTMYVMKKSTLQLAWSPSPEATYYEVAPVWIDPNPNYEYNYLLTNLPQITLIRPRVGHFKFKVRSCNNKGCSDWSESIDSNKAIVDGEPSEWRVYWRLPPPSNIFFR